MSLINTEYFDQLINTIDTVPDCQTLKDIAAEYLEQIQKQIQEQTDAIARIATPDLEILATTPTTLPEQIAWTAAYIDYNIAPVIEEISNITSQITATQAQLARLISAIGNKASQFTNCTVPI
jgi:hypothetical protein